jgi:integrase
MQKNNRIISYSSSLSEIFKGFIDEKHAIGYKYKSTELLLKRFDNFCISVNYSILSLTKEIVLMWTVKQPHETEKNRIMRISLMRLLGSYMQRMGYEAYIYPAGIDKLSTSKYIPFIFSNKEIVDILKQADLTRHHVRSPYRHKILPLLFRILYGCGLRISEVLDLKVKDVLLEDKVLRILNSKFSKDRLVPMCQSLSLHCIDYMKAVHFFNNPEEYFFPSPFGGKFNTKTIYNYFRKFLWKAGISHGGKGKGPRLHDLRHTFAVHCLRNWVDNGIDVSVALPYLSVYLGHTGLNNTQHYLRLTAQLYPSIISAVESKYENLIPGGDES